MVDCHFGYKKKNPFSPPPQKKHNDQKFKHLSKVPVFFFIGEFSQKLDLKIMILTNVKDFSWEKNGPNWPNFEN
jgi:hypothetical protein